MKEFDVDELYNMSHKDSELLTLIEEGDWDVDGKYQTCQLIFIDQESQNHYSIPIYRSGSPFSEYYYCWEDWRGTKECHQVKQVEVTTKVWINND